MEKVLHFSGGKDSLALLYLLKDEWDEVFVMWCNTGKAYPLTMELMQSVKEMVPHFLEVHSDQDAFLLENGYPSDLVPSTATTIGRVASGLGGMRFISNYNCCAANIWIPLFNATKLVGGKVVYRGQKASDRLKSPSKDGYQEYGITYRYPLEQWTDAEVKAFLSDKLPSYYRVGEQSSRDCWDCTAYLEENVARINRLPEPQRIVVTGRLQTLLSYMNHTQRLLSDCLNEVGAIR